jgi:hypothetical protein
MGGGGMGGDRGNMLSGMPSDLSDRLPEGFDGQRTGMPEGDMQDWFNGQFPDGMPFDMPDGFDIGSQGGFDRQRPNMPDRNNPNQNAS